MKESGNSERAYPVKLPPSLNYQINWANSTEKAQIIERLIRGGRQTMNVRTMPQARFLILRDQDKDGLIVGWQGLDYESNPGYTEKFSLHLDQDYRSFLLGLALEHACALHLREQGISGAYVRMDTLSNSSLKEYRIKAGFLKQISTENLDPVWVGQCSLCELHKKTCLKPGFFEFQVAKLIEFADRRLGSTSLKELPAELKLVAERLRLREDQITYRASWAA